METIEDIILQHGARGMDLLRPLLAEDFCHRAARRVLAAERGTVLLTTGFYVSGFAETDGPAGTAALIYALRRLGFTPVVVTDEPCRDYFEPLGTAVEYMAVEDGEAYCRGLLEKWKPKLLISVERCGRNTEGRHASMRGIDLDAHTAPVELLFELTAGFVPSIGVGDGGNEIGMGCFRKTISEKLSLVPCEVPVDEPVIASVSNRGAYGIAACLQKLTGQNLLIPAGELEDYFRYTLTLGSVDGMSGKNEPKVDGFPIEEELAVLEQLRKLTKVNV